MSVPTLYDLCTELDAMCQALEVCEDDAEREALALRVGEYLMASEEKVDRFNAFLSHLEAIQEQAANEVERLCARKARIMRIQERLESYAVRALEAGGMKQLEGRTSALSLRKNPATVAILDQTQIPQSLMRSYQPPPSVPDKTAIAKLLKAGETVPGAELRPGKNRLVRS